MQDHITIAQAYKGMFVFIKNYYKRKGKRSELGILLGDIQLMSHLYGSKRKENDPTQLNSADPASWQDWLEADDAIRREEHGD